MTKTMNKTIKIILFYLLIALIFITYLFFHTNSMPLKEGVYIQQPKPTEPFQLVDNKGQVFTENQLKQHWSLVFFGFSSCQMVCPLALQNLDAIYDSFLKENKVQVIFISVDPERDSIARLDQFLQGINKDFIGLRGPMPAINTLQKQWKVAVSSTAASHGREILLLNPEGRVQAYFYYPIEPKVLMSDLKMVINRIKGV